MHISIHRTHLSGLAALVAAVALAAPAGASAAAAPTKITFAQATPTLLWAPIYLAVDAGYFKKNGLDVSVVQSGGASIAMEAVLSGSAQVASGGLSDDIALASQGKSLQAFATLATGDPDDIVVSKQFAASAHLTTSSPLAAKVKALKGATIGLAPGAALPQELLEWTLRPYGLSLSDVTIIPEATPATALTSLQHGRIDAILFPPPVPQGAVADDGAVMWIDASEGEIKPPYWTGLLATPSYIQNNPTVVKAFAKSMNEALQYIASHKAAAGKKIRSNFSTMTTADYNATWNSVAPVFAPSVAVTNSQYTGVLKFLKGTGTKVPSSLTFGTVATTKVGTAIGAKAGS